MDSDYRILVIDYIGPSLENVMNNNKCFNQNNVMKVGLKLIDLIENLHNNGVVHRDIKPENFLINRNINTIRYIMNIIKLFI